MENQFSSSSSSWIESIKNTLNPSSLMEGLQRHKSQFIDVGIYGSVGFLLGFVVKHYSRYFLITSLLLIALFGLQHWHVVSIEIDWQKIYDLFSMHSTSMPEASFAGVFEWGKSHLLLSITFILSFLIGFKCG